MDLNDIQKRIERTYKSVNGRIESDGSKYLIAGNFNNPLGLKFAIKEPNEQEIHLLLIGIVHSVANLKDHLKNVLSSQGKQKIVEDAINANLELQLLMDLNNADKHGYPLNKTRSGLDPIMIEHQHILHGEAGTQINGIIKIEFYIDEKDQQFKSRSTSEITRCDLIAIATAKIVDINRKFIMNFDSMIFKSLDVWEEIIKNNNLIVPKITTN
ncbi:hypothetical protein [Pedobacter sp. UC225_65]|uniref:hypothetical protein n=1 Tax=Pedobacter sp. UC225_65 TaxID=3350173 RepID=UPI00366D2436